MNTFDNHWSNVADNDIPGKKLEIARKFLEPVINELHKNDSNKSASILDAGCGDGVHLKVFKEISGRIYSRYTAINISSTAIKKIQAENNSGNVIAKVGDIQYLKEDSETYDLVISYGVIGYISNPEKAVSELVRVLKGNGIIAVWIYPANNIVKKKAFNIARGICRSMGERWTSALCHVLVPLMPIMPITSKVSLFNASWKACHEVLMVNLNPKNLILLTENIIIRWLKENGCEVLDIKNSISGAVYARKI